MGALTAAHRTLPLGSMIRVTNLTNGKHVRVRINDRGLYVNGRILDLSLAAADRLGMIHGGLSVIQLEVIGDRRPDFMLAAEESASSTSPLLSIHRLNQPELRVPPVSVLALADPAMTTVHRLPPTDILLQRRIRRTGSMLAADHTAHPENVTLIPGCQRVPKHEPADPGSEYPNLIENRAVLCARGSAESSGWKRPQ